jgi:Protein of unknown function (DUF2752)
MKNILGYKITLAVIVLAITAYYFLVNPAETNFGFQCLFYKTTGLYCMGCGGQRAFHTLLHGDFRHAFQNNLLIYIVLPLVGIKFFEEIFNKKILGNFLYSQKAIMFIAFFVLLFTILRNLPYSYFAQLRP